MKVMLLETGPHSADEVARRLLADGHQIVRCHDEDQPTWPCNGLRCDRHCPLDDGIDVVVDVRALSLIHI